MLSLSASYETTTNDATIPLDGVALYVDARFTPPSLRFWPQPTGTTSPPQYLTLTNQGTVEEAISSIGISGANSSDFAIFSHNCPPTLPVDALCTIAITFTRMRAGRASRR